MSEFDDNNEDGREERPVTDREVSERRTLAYTVLVLIMGFCILTSFNIWYTNKEIRESDRIKCALFVGLDDRYSALPGADKDQMELIVIVRQLRNDLPCGEDSHAPFPPLVSPQPQPSTTPTPVPTLGG